MEQDKNPFLIIYFSMDDMFDNISTANGNG